MRTITLCSGKGGVGKTLLATSLGRIIQRQEKCNVLLVDLDLSVRGLTLLAFQNKYELGRLPFSLTDYFYSEDGDQPALLHELQKGLAQNNGHAEESPELMAQVTASTKTSTYERLDGLFIIPSSTESERPDWTPLHHLELTETVEKLGKLYEFATSSLHVDYIIFDTQAGLGSLSLAATTLSDMNLIVLEEDDISWRTSLNALMEISALNKRLQRKSHSYFLANKVSSSMMDVADKLKAFSFLPPVPFDAWVQKLFAHATTTVLEKDFEGSDFFKQVESQVWQELAVILGVRQRTTENSPQSSWWRG